MYMSGMRLFYTNKFTPKRLFGNSSDASWADYWVLFTRKGRPISVPGLLSLIQCHFPEYVSLTEKRAVPCRSCAVCCIRRMGKKKEKGKKQDFILGIAFSAYVLCHAL